MAIKKSELYSSLWKSCDELRGGMDASQYKDYVLVFLFVKYVSDRYAGRKDALVEVPAGASFADMVALKGDKEIGDKINKIISKLAEANNLKGVIDVADFNDADKLGKGKDMVDRLSNLVAIFDNPALNFKGNTAEGDDLLGDAYEYLMRHFATESGKSKGQFYTPAEVSRIMAKVIGVDQAKSQTQSIYDPTCGSGSLLLKAHDEAKEKTGLSLTIYGQEMDNATSALARMNMILHDCPEAEIWKDNTLSTPYFKQPNGKLKTFDFVVANPPFSNKTWRTGFNPFEDEYERFTDGVPPAKNGDYAFMLHVITSLKSTGIGAIVMPHGVLSRGNEEARIRRTLIKRGYIKGIIGLPANLFYGTGIPACIVILDKESATERKGIFMIDASKGFRKDGNKNRLRERDIHRIVEAFNKQAEIDNFSRFVPNEEIADAKNDFNLNLPRYIDTSEPEDIQDIAGHLRGGIPDRDLDALEDYWKVFPALRKKLFESAGRPGYSQATVPITEIKQIIVNHDEFSRFTKTAKQLFENWKTAQKPRLESIGEDDKPKQLLAEMAESLLATFRQDELIDAYDVYQHLLDYWTETMQDDFYMLVSDGWEGAKKIRLIVETKDQKTKEKPDFVIKKKKYKADFISPELIINHFFPEEQVLIKRLQEELATTSEQKDEFIAENTAEEALLEDITSETGKVTRKAINDRLKEIMGDSDFKEEVDALLRCLEYIDSESSVKSKLKEKTSALETRVIEKYAKLSVSEIQEILIENKWISFIDKSVKYEILRVSNLIADRLSELTSRYAKTLPELKSIAERLTTRVDHHLKQVITSDLLTGKTRLQGFAEDWQFKSIGEIFNFYSTATNSRADLSDDGDTYYIHYGDIHTKFHNHLDFGVDEIPKTWRSRCNNATFLRNGDWIMVDASEDYSGVGKSVEVVGLKPGVQAVAGLHTFLLREKKPTYEPGFKGHLGNLYNLHTEFLRIATGLKVYSISKTALRDLMLPIPSPEEQTAIATVLSDMDAELIALDAKREKTKALKQGMMQELLAGRTKLK